MKQVRAEGTPIVCYSSICLTLYRTSDPPRNAIAWDSEAHSGVSDTTIIDMIEVLHEEPLDQTTERRCTRARTRAAAED